MTAPLPRRYLTVTRPLPAITGYGGLWLAGGGLWRFVADPITTTPTKAEESEGSGDGDAVAEPLGSNP